MFNKDLTYCCCSSSSGGVPQGRVRLLAITIGGFVGAKMEWRWRGTQMEIQDRFNGLEGSGWLVDTSIQLDDAAGP